jgi:hypothetical protein
MVGYSPVHILKLGRQVAWLNWRALALLVKRTTLVWHPAGASNWKAGWRSVALGMGV